MNFDFYNIRYMKKFLKKAWEGWKKIAHRIGRFQTMLLLSLFYFLVIAPLGSLFRLFGWDPLETKGFKSGKQSSWRKIDSKSHQLESLKHQS